MLISLDVDSVLLKTEERVLEEIKNLYNIKLDLKDITYWNFYKDHYPLVLDFFNNTKFYDNVDKIDNMDIVLNSLIKKYGSNNIQLVTSSNEILAKQKEACLFKNFSNINHFNKLKIIHVGFYDEDEINTQHEKYHYTKGTILVDDAIHNIESHIINNNKEALIVDFDYGWNQNFEHKLVQRVKTPFEIIDNINNLLK